MFHANHQDNVGKIIIANLVYNEGRKVSLLPKKEKKKYRTGYKNDVKAQIAGRSSLSLSYTLQSSLHTHYMEINHCFIAYQHD